MAKLMLAALRDSNVAATGVTMQLTTHDSCTHATGAAPTERHVQQNKASAAQERVQEAKELADALVDEADVALGAHEHEAEQSVEHTAATGETTAPKLPPARSSG